MMSDSHPRLRRSRLLGRAPLGALTGLDEPARHAWPTTRTAKAHLRCVCGWLGLRGGSVQPPTVWKEEASAFLMRTVSLVNSCRLLPLVEQ